MSEKEHIEAHVAMLFLERTKNIRVTPEALCFGNPEQGEPDILYEDMGVEIGAVLKGTNTQIDIYETKFLQAASERIAGKIPESVQIRLVMQDDKGTVKHTPKPAFQSYKYFPKYLDGIFVLRYDARKVEDKVVLNQKTRMRELTFPGNLNGKEFIGFIDELAEFVTNLQKSDYTDRGECMLHHSVVTDGTVVKQAAHPLDDFVSSKIMDKLSKNKYSGTYSTQLLLLHNYSLLGNSQFTSDIHFYSHHRDDVFNLLWNKINEFQSFRFYNGIYFLDFSVYARNSNFELIDFSNYSQRAPSDFLYGYDEIRCDIGAVFPSKGQK